MKQPFRFGIDVLCDEHADWLRGLRVGLVAHAASVSTSGISTPEFLPYRGADVTCLFGPEHGFLSCGSAGEEMAHGKHPKLKIPIYSLYGETRKPTAKMLKGVDVIVFDLHDLGARPYTYVSTLRLVLEAAAENGKRVIVTDRPSPLSNTVDGPMLNPAFESFVSFVRTPVVYGMTPGEMALWLKKDLKLDVDVRVAPMAGFQRGIEPKRPWIRPSPAIKSWECGLCFPITVFLEALPALDHGRGTDAPFQRVGAPWLNARKLSREMNAMNLSGFRFTTCRYKAMTGSYKGRSVHGVNIQITDASEYLPVQAGLALLRIVHDIHGADTLWSHPGTREAFFDQLMGTDTVRRALIEGRTLVEITAPWALQSANFWQSRKSCLRY
jgi:uncharacterized protein YbbC (DUF1343 family)